MSGGTLSVVELVGLPVLASPVVPDIDPPSVPPVGSLPPVLAAPVEAPVPPLLPPLLALELLSSPPPESAQAQARTRRAQAARGDWAVMETSSKSSRSHMPQSAAIPPVNSPDPLQTRTAESPGDTTIASAVRSANWQGP